MFDAWKERQRQRLKNRPERTVFYNIFATLMLVLAVELLMAVASILAVNVTGQLDENAKDLLHVVGQFRPACADGVHVVGGGGHRQIARLHRESDIILRLGEPL